MNSDSPIRVIITDDHQMFTDGMLSLLGPEEWITVNGTANNGQALLNLLSSTPTDLVLLDIHMPEMDGLETTEKLLKDFPEVKVLMLTMSAEPQLIERLVKAGAHGYILKNTGKSELLQAIRAVAGGSTYYSQEVSRIYMESLRKPKQPARSNKADSVPLTKREKDVLRLIAQEHTTAEIAEKLFISINTVETHRKNLLSKLQLRNSAGLARFAAENGLLSE